MSPLQISDPTLRDGNHAISHQLNEQQITEYITAVDKSGVNFIEVGHGNGLGASSFQVGLSLLEDNHMLHLARKHIKHALLSVHVIPGFASINKNIKDAVDIGVDVFRVASHCTEADITYRHIEFIRSQNKICHGVLMMSHMTSKEKLVEEALKMQSYGAQAVIIMDSAGSYLPANVSDRIHILTTRLKIPIGFHAHNNLGMAIANSISAVNAGATIIDGTARGFGAGAGNTQIEALIAVLEKMEIKTDVNLYKILDAAEVAEKHFIKTVPYPDSLNIISGLSGVFSGFRNHVKKISDLYGVDPRILFIELGKRKAIAGQEDMIIELAKKLSNNSCYED